MPFGPFQDFESCMSDPGLVERFPGEDVRRRVCGALKARLESSRDAGDAIAGNVTESEAFFLVHDVVAAREGVNKRGEFKPWSELRVAAASLEGAPLVYGGVTGHPLDADGFVVVDVDPRSGVGHAVNVRADEATRRIVYDALLFKGVPESYSVSAVDVARNRELVAHVRGGGAVDNSVGYHVREVADGGVFQEEDGSFVAFTRRQEAIRFGHVSILSPFSPHGGACSVEMGCGFNADHDGCKGGDGCCSKRLEALVGSLMRGGLSRGAALKVILDTPKNRR